MPYHPISLRQWALAEGISPDKAYRQFHAGTLVDRAGNRVHAQRQGSGVIEVYPEGPPDPLANVDIHALVARLLDAGYVLLTREQAAELGVEPAPAVQAASVT